MRLSRLASTVDGDGIAGPTTPFAFYVFCSSGSCIGANSIASGTEAKEPLQRSTIHKIDDGWHMGKREFKIF